MIIGAPKGIPFVRVYPDNSLKVQTIERPAEIDVLASSFIARGGRYLIAMLSDDEVKMTAIVQGVGDDVHEVAAEVSPNGIALPLAVDRLVRASVARIAAVQ